MPDAPPLSKDELEVLVKASELYPVTVEELGRAVKLREGAFERALRTLVRRGYLVLEPLSDCTWVRPMVLAGSTPPTRPPDEDDPAFL